MCASRGCRRYSSSARRAWTPTASRSCWHTIPTTSTPCLPCLSSTGAHPKATPACSNKVPYGPHWLLGSCLGVPGVFHVLDTLVPQSSSYHQMDSIPAGRQVSMSRRTSCWSAACMRWRWRCTRTASWGTPVAASPTSLRRTGRCSLRSSSTCRYAHNWPIHDGCTEMKRGVCCPPL